MCCPGRGAGRSRNATFLQNAASTGELPPLVPLVLLNAASFGEIPPLVLQNAASTGEFPPYCAATWFANPCPALPYPTLPAPALPYPTLPYPGVCLLCASTTQRFDMGNCHGMPFFELESCLCRMTAIEPSRIHKKQPPREGCLFRRLGNTLLQQGAIQSTVGVCVCVRPAEMTQHRGCERRRFDSLLGPARVPPE